MKTLDLPLIGNADKDAYKIYMKDIGLLVAMLEDGAVSDIMMSGIGRYKGAIYENLVADILVKCGYEIYYYKKDSGLEIDFIVRNKNAIVPIEIKSTTGNAKSLKTLIMNSEKNKIVSAYKFGDYNMGKVGNIITCPFYTLFLP